MDIKADTPQQWHRKRFGWRLRTLREDRKRSREWLAEQLGVDKQTVARLEKGNAPVELHLIAAAAAALECSVATLVESLFPENELAAGAESYLISNAAYQRASEMKERLDRQVALRFKILRKELDEMTYLFSDAHWDEMLQDASLVNPKLRYIRQ